MSVVKKRCRRQPCQILLSLKGIAEASAIALLGELLVLPRGMAART